MAEGVNQEKMVNGALPPKNPELRRRDRLARNTLVLYLITGLTVAFVTPDNILEHPWARWYVNLMDFIPYVEKAGQASPIPQVAQFFAAVMWVLSWPLLLPMWRAAYPLPSEIANRRIRVRQILKYSGFILVCIFAVVWVVFYPSFDTRSGRLQIGSRIGLGIFGTIFLGTVPFLSMLVIFFIRNWRHIVYGDADEIVKRNSKFH